MKHLLTDRHLNKNITTDLIKLGLSRDAARCYQVLVRDGSLSAQEIAIKIGVYPNAIYRLIRKLIVLKIAVKLDAYPAYFQAVPLSAALETLTQSKITELDNLKTLTKFDIGRHPFSPISPTDIKIISGQEAMMQNYVDLIKDAKSEILIISIGEQVPDEVRLADRDALQKGITIKFIIQKYDKNNKGIIDAWVKMGIEVRLYPESGYHLMIADGNRCILSSSNIQNTEERNSVIINGAGLSRAMRNYFYSIWDKTPINVTGEVK